MLVLFVVFNFKNDIYNVRAVVLSGCTAVPKLNHLLACCSNVNSPLSIKKKKKPRLIVLFHHRIITLLSPSMKAISGRQIEILCLYQGLVHRDGEETSINRGLWCGRRTLVRSSFCVI